NNNDLIIDVDKMTVKKNNSIVDLTTNEFKVLLTLVSNPEQVLSRDQLIDAALGDGFEGYDRTIDTYIKNIRQKIEVNPKKPKYINTVYGAGYTFKADSNKANP